MLGSCYDIREAAEGLGRRHTYNAVQVVANNKHHMAGWKLGKFASKNTTEPHYKGHIGHLIHCREGLYTVIGG